MKLGKYTEQELVEMIREGRKARPFLKAVDCLEKELKPTVDFLYNDFPLLKERNMVSAESILNYTVLEVIRSIEKGQYRGDSRLITYAHTIAKRRCIREKRYLIERKDTPPPDLNGFTFGDTSIPVFSTTLREGNTEEEELEDLMFRMEKELSEKELAAIKAIFIEEKPYKEYATETEDTVGALKVRVHRAKDKLKKLFSTKTYAAKSTS